MHLEIVSAGLKMGIIDFDLQGRMAISTQEKAFNVALVSRSRPAKGCYTLLLHFFSGTKSQIRTTYIKNVSKFHSSVGEKLSWFIRQASDGLYIL